jgi:hypothetical protein
MVEICGGGGGGVAVVCVAAEDGVAESVAWEVVVS